MSNETPSSKKALFLKAYQSAIGDETLDPKTALAISNYVALLESQFRAALKTIASNELLPEYNEVLHVSERSGPTIH